MQNGFLITSKSFFFLFSQRTAFSTLSSHYLKQKWNQSDIQELSFEPGLSPQAWDKKYKTQHTSSSENRRGCTLSFLTGIRTGVGWGGGVWEGSCTTCLDISPGCSHLHSRKVEKHQLLFIVYFFLFLFCSCSTVGLSYQTTFGLRCCTVCF